MEDNKKNFKVFTFDESYIAPKYHLNKGRGLVEWGWNRLNVANNTNNNYYGSNNYPQYILDLYNHYGSPVHKAIIDRKVRYIAGQGFDEITDQSLLDFIRKNKLEDHVMRMALDYELFNGFCFEIIWNKEGDKINKIKHVNFHKIRIGLPTEENPDEDFEYYWYSEDWNQYRKEDYAPQFIRGWDPENPGGRQLYYYKEYNPEADYYPIPPYSSCFNWIEIGYEISKFHLNSSKNGYAPGFILNFATGIPTQEEQDEFSKAFKREYGTNANAGKVVITWSEGSDQKPELTPVNGNDSDERFTQLEGQVKDEIVVGSGVPIQMMAVVPGKLGASDERMELMQEFQMDYISPRQTIIEDCLNSVLNTNLIRLKKYTK
jgi:hypothetical protein